ncbi:nitrate- and nitrite sensing domain-containing protein [Saccharopolyspora sp. TS4A08]|uniref:histidine kinase n=1 Tax=Saccharopolyspora ipomoeae TaxID=3042027 RepID=A0ABT6PH96_9PSEU|nr:nitrate- and nitrite sensing domain-containing protein [Saccharopolyspora sp. TS4A08]MDI2027373.1 nitrate- and nitrite sensing domain-containing protein [Saccharopolyspora sp. TS4A08]
MTSQDAETHHRTIKKRLSRALTLPIVLLSVVLLSSTVPQGVESFVVWRIGVAAEDAGGSAMRAFAALQHERDLSVREGIPTAELGAARVTSDRTTTELVRTLDSLTDYAPEPIAVKTEQLKKQLAELPQRRLLSQGRLNRRATVEYFNATIDTGIDLFDTQSRLAHDIQVTQDGITATELLRASDLMRRAAMLGGSAVDSGRFEAGEHHAFAEQVFTYRSRIGSESAHAAPEVQRQYRALTASPAWQRLTAVEDRLVADGATGSHAFPPEQQRAWHDDVTTVGRDLNELALAQSDHAITLGMTQAYSKFVWTILVVLVALAAVALCWWYSWRNIGLAEQVLQRLARLRDAVRHRTHDLLPPILARAREGKEVDVDDELGKLDFGRDEIGEVADAMEVSQRATIDATIKEAGTHAAFRSAIAAIASGQQTLIQQAIVLIDAAEHDEQDPAKLRRLLQVDSTVTRLRRKIENLRVLAGDRPGRRWRDPVPLSKLVQSAIGETEHYTRINVRAVPPVAVKGPAVTDTIRVLAELMDNATRFSPPTSPVLVRVDRTTGDRVLVEIEDRGLGMPAADRERINETLSAPPDFTANSVQDDVRLGMVVVSRLAQRRGIEVALHPGEGSGIRASVVLPADLITSPAQPRQGADRQGVESTVRIRRKPRRTSTSVEPESTGGLPQRRRGTTLARLTSSTAADDPEPPSDEPRRSGSAAFMNQIQRARSQQEGRS